MSVSRKSFIVIILLLVAAATSSYFLVRLRGTEQQLGDEAYLKVFKEALGIVKKSYFEEFDSKKLMQGAIDGMLATLDPHSNYLPADSFKEMNIQMTGSFGGIGTEISIKENRLTVIAPIEDTPAWRAGIKANDHIWKIDNTFTKGMSINEAVKRMRGDKGTRVTITILRNGLQKPLVFPLVRDIIKTKSLRFRSLEPGYGYIRIAQFQERTADDFAKALETIHNESGGQPKGLIIDLRNNPGGLLDAAVKVADRFIGEGFGPGLIVYTDGRTPAAKRQHTAFVGEKEPHYPMVVLINGGSASASEILAGALQDHKRAVVMGTQSFGKGSVQSVFPLRDGAGLKLTTARYYTPNGRSIQAKGIVPDIIVNQVDLAKLPATGEKQPEFREENIDNHIKPADIPAAPARQPAAPPQPSRQHPQHQEELAHDYQLSRALELLHGLTAMEKVVH